MNRVDAWGLADDGGWSLLGIEFGGDGRPWWQPREGNWGGGDWSGGVNPKQGGGEDGTAPSKDSADDIYKTHDTDWKNCDNADILANDPEKWRKECKRSADRELVEGLERLPADPKQWIMPPAPGKERAADWFRTGAKWIFK